ncbi:MAG: serine/threonine-protein kinase, partial [Polyangiales bacterium]
SLRKQGRKPSVKEVLYIGMEICKGLHHAHNLHDESGSPLNIVHRDISPPNILITRGGEVKVTDFGLAKATTQLEKTDPGVVKGKFSYLSPEAALGQEVDARTDVFAVGILMWEALAGKRLFLGDSDYDTVKKVQRADVPALRMENGDVDDELDALLHKAMARRREDRFQDAAELGDAIADYLFRHRLKVTSYDIARLMQEVLKAKRVRRDSSVIDQLIQDELLAFTSLDEMSDPLNPRASVMPPATERATARPAGARPLDAGSFTGRGEDPSAWFSEDDIDKATSFFDRGSMETPEPSQAGKITGKSDPRDLAALLEKDDETGRGRLPSSQPADLDKLFDAVDGAGNGVETIDAPEDPTRYEGPAKKPPPPPPGAVKAPKASSGAALRYVAFAFLVLAGGAAAAWFGGLIPH